MSLSELFQSVGLSEEKAKETIKNEALAKKLQLAIEEAKKTAQKDTIERNVGVLLYHVASKTKKQAQHHIPMLAQDVALGGINSEVKLNAAIEYLMGYQLDDLNRQEYELACGYGCNVSPQEIREIVSDILKKKEKEIKLSGAKSLLGAILGEARATLKWADGKEVKIEVDQQLKNMELPDPEKTKPKSSKEKKNGNKTSTATTNKPDDGAQTMSELLKKVVFHAPGENYKTDGYVMTKKTMELLSAHKSKTMGKVRTRFPPEPNGILHIGHAKAININFGYAAANEGVCYLRYDDTNPEKEEEKFFKSIKEMVEWLGYKPWKITHSSDNFDQLYEWAKVLIRLDAAYVCHQKSEDIKGFNPPPSPWRERPVHESLLLFDDMKNGKLDEGEATLRLKICLEEGKQDPVAYRIKFTPHHRTGNKWCIYPTYDYTHCLCDSLEDITHSLCTKEFQSRRSSYYWLCNTLGVYCPVQWEYGRLNLNYTVVSKRKIGKLISEGIVKSWDDPRLFTLTALRRRGVPPEAINNFCARLGLTGAQTSVDPIMLDASIRDELNETASRKMVVLEPLKVKITNFPYKEPHKISVPDFPAKSNSSTHNVTLASTIYIERSDFREDSNDKSYRRLTSDSCVGLRHAGLVITVTKVHKNKDGSIDQLEVTCDDAANSLKPKAFIHWVAEPIQIEIRSYERLFRSKHPEEVEGGFLNDCNKDSVVVHTALADGHLHNVSVYDKFQFERTGFFSVDPDTQPGKIVFNRTVSLKEDSGKN